MVRTGLRRGDSNFNPSSSSVTEEFVTASSTPAPTAPPAVTLSGTPSVSSSSPTIYYKESGSVSSTVCMIDGAHVGCDSSHAVLSQLGRGKHTFMVQVFGAGGSAHASVTWSVVPPHPVGRRTRTYKLGASARSFHLRLRRRQHARVSLRATGRACQGGGIAVLSVT